MHKSNSYYLKKKKINFNLCFQGLRTPEGNGSLLEKCYNSAPPQAGKYQLIYEEKDETCHKPATKSAEGVTGEINILRLYLKNYLNKKDMVIPLIYV